MYRMDWLLLSLLVCIGCQRDPIDQPNQVASEANAVSGLKAVLENKLVSEPTISEEKIFDTLTANSWKSLPLNERHPDHSVSTFRADGTYSYEFFTDYNVPAKIGKWHLQSLQGQWYICQDDGKRVTITLNEDGSITLHHGKLYPHKPLQRQQGQTAKTLPPLQLLPEV